MNPRLRIGLSALVTLNVVFVMVALWFSVGLDALPDEIDDGHGHLLGFNRPFTWGHMILAFAHGSLRFDKLAAIDVVFLLMHVIGLLVIWLPDSLSILRRAFMILQVMFIPFALAGVLLWIGFIGVCLTGNMDMEGFEVTPLNSIGASVVWVAIWLTVWRHERPAPLITDIPLKLIPTTTP